MPRRDVVVFHQPGDFLLQFLRVVREIGGAAGLCAQKELSRKRLGNLPEHCRIIRSKCDAIAQFLGRVDEVAILLDIVSEILGRLSNPIELMANLDVRVKHPILVVCRFARGLIFWRVCG